MAGEIKFGLRRRRQGKWNREISATPHWQAGACGRDDACNRLHCTQPLNGRPVCKMQPLHVTTHQRGRCVAVSGGRQRRCSQVTQRMFPGSVLGGINKQGDLREIQRCLHSNHSEIAALQSSDCRQCLATRWSKTGCRFLRYPARDKRRHETSHFTCPARRLARSPAARFFSLESATHLYLASC
jgi:radical SAM protein with 4Fe4S-binding SPASM domain